MPLTIHKRPAASKIQPMKLRGRLEAIRAPTRGKAKKGNRSKSPPTVRSTPQLLGTCADRARTNSGMRAKIMAAERGERPGEPGGGAGTHPAALSSPLSCPLCHYTTLQHFRPHGVTITFVRVFE